LKFLQSEYKSIVQIIVQSGHDESSFSFVKKRGKVNINYRSSDATFYFFRKTETVLDEAKNWVRQTSYKYGIGKNEISCDDWNELLRAFEKWLKDIKENTRNF